MKRIFSILPAAFAAMTMLLVASCKDPNEIKPIENPVLSIDKTDLQFEEYGDDAAITFSWKAPTGETSVSYILMITKSEDKGFASCTDFEVSGTSKTFTSAGVRDFANALKVDLSQGASFIAKVMATAGAGRTSYSNVVEFTATKNNAGYETIYPIGAMDWDWDPAKAEMMKTDDGIVYTWTGMLKAKNSFKFLCQNDGNWIPSYNRDANAENYWTVYKKTEDWQPDDCFKVSESGKYKITLNIVDLTVAVDKVVENPGMYPVGGSFACGWDNTLAEPMMTWNDKDYFWAGWLNVGTFKFLCYKDNWVPSYNRDPNAEYYWTMRYRDDGASDDTLFEITDAGEYIIELNTETLEISCVKNPTYDYPLIYPIGAMSWGWDLASAEHMFTYDGETYFWIGEVKANNDFKFMCSNTEWIPSYNRDENAEDEWTAYYRDQDWQKDTQFKVAEGGIYKLTLNVKTLKVTAERLGDVR